MNKLRSGFIPNHVGYVYEDICRSKMWELNAQGKLPFLFDRVGRWWGGNDTEIDIVAVATNDRSNILFLSLIHISFYHGGVLNTTMMALF